MSRQRRSTLEGSQHLPPTPVLSRSLILSPQEAEQFDDWNRKLMGTSQPVSTVVRSAFFVLGAAMLLGWNVIITAIPYFLTRLADSPYQNSFSSYISLSSTISNFLFLWYATVTSNLQSCSLRIFLAIVIAAILNILFTLSTLVDISPTLFFTFVLANAILQAACAAYLQTAVVALASLFGSASVQSVMSGQAAVGVAVSLVQVISTAGGVGTSAPSPSTGPSITAYPHPSDWGAFTFFTLASLFMVASLGAQTFITRTRHYKYLTKPSTTSNDETTSLLSSILSIDSYEPSREPEQKLGVTEMLLINKTYNFSVAFIFVVTLAVFPPITTLVTSVNPDSTIFSHPLLFSALHFLLFNVGDLLGRFIPSTPRLIMSSPKLLLMFSLSRVLFIPLFLLCNIDPNPSVQPFFNSDIPFFGLVLLLGISNGYGGSTTMISASSLELNPLLQGSIGNVDTAATVGSFSLVFGLGVGSFLSFGVRMVICGGCNPFVS